MPKIDLSEWAKRIDPTRFWAKVKCVDPQECWEWQGSVNREGLPYGRFYLSKTKVCRAHRFAYVIQNGSIPSDLMVCHSCDNPRCCNPAHLWLGTNQDNVDDCRAKNRQSGSADAARHARRFKKHGPAHRQASLTPEMVREIRSSPLRVSDLAKKFGVSKHVISRCRKGQTYPEWSLERPTQERPSNEAEIAQAIASGMSLAETRKRFGVSINTIHRACKKQGLSAYISELEAKQTEKTT